MAWEAEASVRKAQHRFPPADIRAGLSLDQVTSQSKIESRIKALAYSGTRILAAKPFFVNRIMVHNRKARLLRRAFLE